jgi:hypothetical protein
MTAVVSTPCAWRELFYNYVFTDSMSVINHGSSTQPCGSECTAPSHALLCPDLLSQQDKAAEDQAAPRAGRYIVSAKGMVGHPVATVATASRGSRMGVHGAGHMHVCSNGRCSYAGAPGF